MKVSFQPAEFPILSVILLMSTSLILSACGGSDGGVGGNNQQPDAVVEDYPIAYIKRLIPMDENGNIIP